MAFEARGTASHQHAACVGSLQLAKRKLYCLLQLAVCAERQLEAVRQCTLSPTSCSLLQAANIVEEEKKTEAAPMTGESEVRSSRQFNALLRTQLTI